MAKKSKIINAGVSFYDGEYQVSFDCIGEKRCAHAMFFCEPPDVDDECAKKRQCSCTHPGAQRATLTAIRDRITEDLKQYEFPED